jgi:hypothetical protein|tara:strand:- start:202 stop:324 length:123 start_codon:yes stop_codon:yes gene_type:complete
MKKPNRPFDTATEVGALIIAMSPVVLAILWIMGMLKGCEG